MLLGGCTALTNPNDRRSLDCGTEWSIKHRKPTPFDIDKAKWLKEIIKGRSWTEMMDENDS
jgi:hypothetical protein